MQSRLTPAAKAMIIKDYERGMLLNDILKKYDVQRGSVYHLLRKNGIPFRQPRKSASDREAEATSQDETIEYLLKRVRELEGQAAVEEKRRFVHY